MVLYWRAASRLRVLPLAVREVRRSEPSSPRAAGPLPGTARVVTTLSAHPPGGVIVPFVPGVGESAKCRLDVLLPPLVLQTATNEFSDEGTALTRTDTAIQIGHEVVVERNVQSHVPMLAHSLGVMVNAVSWPSQAPT